MPTQRTTPQSYYYSGQGRLMICERSSTGKPINAYYVGNATALELTVQTTKTEHKESMSGERSIDLTILTEKSATFSITVESLSLKNLALAMWGETEAIAGAAVTDEAHTIVGGGTIVLDHQNVSALTITEDDGTTPVSSSDYTIDPEFGTVTFVATPAYTGDCLVDYTYGVSERLHALTQVAQPERFIRFEGLNTINEDLVLIEIPRAAIEPLQNLPLINEEVASFQMTGTALRDGLITSGSKYFRETIIAPLP